MPLNQENTSVTNLDTVTPVESVLIGKVSIGTELIQELGPRSQHHPPKRSIVELGLLDGFKDLLLLGWVKQLKAMFVLLAVVMIAL